MTFDERVRKITAELYPSPMFADAVRIAGETIIRRALIEQDKITRHAAAEVVKNTLYVRTGHHLVWRNDAIEAVINSRKGVE